MNGWDKEYLLNKDEYTKLFDATMQREQETNIEFLEKSLSNLLNRKVVAVANGTDALHFSLLSLGINSSSTTHRYV